MQGDFGTKKQMEMRNRILLGDGRGGEKKAYVVSNLDVLFENELIDDFQREVGKRYWSWRTTARRFLGFSDNPAYSETGGEEDPMPISDNETEGGTIWEMYNILLGMMPKDHLATVDACCNDADRGMPLLIVQMYTGNLQVFSIAFDSLEKALNKAPEEFKKRCENVKNKVDGNHEYA